MAKFDIHYDNLAEVLNLSVNTIDQKEIKQLVNYFQRYDREADFLFF